MALRWVRSSALQVNANQTLDGETFSRTFAWVEWTRQQNNET